MTQKLTIQLVQANRREAGLVARAQAVKTLLQWFSHDVLALAGPDLAVSCKITLTSAPIHA